MYSFTFNVISALLFDAVMLLIRHYNFCVWLSLRLSANTVRLFSVCCEVRLREFRPNALFS
jgi:hypothetical protein